MGSMEIYCPQNPERPIWRDYDRFKVPVTCEPIMVRDMVRADGHLSVIFE